MPGRALVRGALLVLSDEPLSDPGARLRVGTRMGIEQLHRRAGSAIVHVTHGHGQSRSMAAPAEAIRGRE